MPTNLPFLGEEIHVRPKVATHVQPEGPTQGESISTDPNVIALVVVVIVSLALLFGALIVLLGASVGLALR